MCSKLFSASLAVALVALAGLAQAQDAKKRAGKVIGVVQGQKATKDGKNTFLEVLAPGEEKARSYHVIYDPKLKGPIPAVLAAVRATKKGDRVEIDWIDTNHGPAIAHFKNLSKATEK